MMVDLVIGLLKRFLLESFKGLQKRFSNRKFRCSNCKYPILVHQKFYRHDATGKILCEDCYSKLRA